MDWAASADVVAGIPVQHLPASDVRVWSRRIDDHASEQLLGVRGVHPVSPWGTRMTLPARRLAYASDPHPSPWFRFRVSVSRPVTRPARVRRAHGHGPLFLGLINYLGCRLFFPSLFTTATTPTTTSCSDASSTSALTLSPSRPSSAASRRRPALRESSPLARVSESSSSSPSSLLFLYSESARAAAGMPQTQAAGRPVVGSEVDRCSVVIIRLLSLAKLRHRDGEGAGPQLAGVCLS